LVRSLTLFLIPLILASCEHQLAEDTGLVTQIEVAVDSARDSVVDLRAIGPREWQRAYVFQPYATDSMIADSTGMEWRGSSAIGFEDNIMLLVLATDTAIVAYADVPLTSDLEAVAQRPGLSRDSFRFRVRDAGLLTGGLRWRRLELLTP
jgi:hypothetical protein